MSMAEQFESMVKEFVETTVADLDFKEQVTDAVTDEIGDLDDKISDIVDNKLSDAVKDEVADQIKDAVNDAVGDEVGDLDDKVSEAMDNMVASPEFAEKIEEVVRKSLRKVIGEMIMGMMPKEEVV
jgi:predicted component of type VI protein secretion system